ncbi:MAG: branched-chain amino acid ABC transporter permease [Anaerolineae bacterium]|nr:branched-chain amino acid ABC transporter permease [Anaerolineae bacterium]
MNTKNFSLNLSNPVVSIVILFAVAFAFGLYATGSFRSVISPTDLQTFLQEPDNADLLEAYNQDPENFDITAYDVDVSALGNSQFELNIQRFFGTLVSGLFQGMLLFLVASGLSLIFGLMDILNFAQGAYFMVGAYVTWDIQNLDSGVPFFNQIGAAFPDPNIRFLVGLGIAVGLGAILGFILERGLLRPLYSRPLFQLVLTFGVSLIMLEVIKAIWGTNSNSWTSVMWLNSGTFTVFGQQDTTYRLFVIAVGIAMIIAIALLLRRTKLGIIVRAGVEDAEMVDALGINVRAIFTLIFTLGCALAALGGAVATPFLGVRFTMGTEFLLASIAAIVLGGLGSYEGTAVASILVGFMWAFAQVLGARPDVNNAIWFSIMPMVLLTIVLLLRPSGIFGKDRG